MRRSRRCRACGAIIDRDEKEHVLVQFKPYARRVSFHRECFDEASAYYRITISKNGQLTVQEPAPNQAQGEA
jgi:hypothetical protein